MLQGKLKNISKDVFFVCISTFNIYLTTFSVTTVHIRLNRIESIDIENLSQLDLRTSQGSKQVKSPFL